MKRFFLSTAVGLSIITGFSGLLWLLLSSEGGDPLDYTPEICKGSAVCAAILWMLYFAMKYERATSLIEHARKHASQLKENKTAWMITYITGNPHGFFPIQKKDMKSYRIVGKMIPLQDIEASVKNSTLELPRESLN